MGVEQRGGSAVVMDQRIQSRFIEARGLRTHYLQVGAGPPLLLLHGWPEWSHTWHPVMARLADGFELYAPDFRGFGASQKTSLLPARDATPDVLSADVLAFADALGLERFGLVSHDVGAFVAQVIARQAPQRLSGLFFFNAPYPGIGARWLAPRHALETWYQSFHQMPWAAELVGSSRDACRIYFRAFLRHWSHRPDAFDAELETWVDNFMQPGNLQGGFNWYLSVHESRMAVIEGSVTPPPPIDLPARVFWGAHDPIMKPEWGDRLPEFFTQLEFDLAPDAGHFVHYETPDRASREIRRFFDKLYLKAS
jgi:pimeloyl-ACP methyl ester carboxylesterase